MHETKFFDDKHTPKISLYKTCLMLNSNVFCVTKDVPTVPRPSFFKPNNNSYQNSPNKMVPPPPPPPPYKPSPSSQRPPFQGALPDVLSRPNENHHSTFLQSRGDYTLHTLKKSGGLKKLRQKGTKLNQIESTKKKVPWGTKTK